MASSRVSPTISSISSPSIFLSSFLDSFSSFINLAPWLSRMEIKDNRFKRESFIRTLPKNIITLVTYKGVLLHVCCFFSASKLAVQSKTNVPTRNKNWKRVCARTKIYLSKPFWTVVFQVWQAFSSCALLLFPSSSAAEVLPDLVLLFLLSSARTYLLLTDELNHFMFLLLLAVPTQ
jgi:hypothetical protein